MIENIKPQNNVDSIAINDWKEMIKPECRANIHYVNIV